MTASRLDRAKRFLLDNPWASCALLALVIRVVFVVVQERYAILDISFDASDSVAYRGLAESLRSGDGYAFEGHVTAYVTPGYPLLLAALYTFSSATIFIGLVQTLIGAATVGLVAALGSRVGGVRAAWAAGLLGAIYPHHIFWTGYVLTETLYTFTVILSLYLTFRAIQERSTRVAAFAGFSWGAAALTRPMALGFALLILAVGFLSSSWRRLASVGSVGLVLLVGAWTVRNVITMDSLIVTSTESGIVLWQGNSPHATGGSRGYVDGQDFRSIDLPPGTSEIDKERIYRESALEWMAENPGKVLALVPKKLWNMFRPTYEGSSALNQTAILATYPLLLIGGVWGLWLVRKKRLAFILLGGFFIYSLVVHGLITGMIRFRLPAEMALMPSFGVAMASVFPNRET